MFSASIGGHRCFVSCFGVNREVLFALGWSRCLSTGHKLSFASMSTRGVDYERLWSERARTLPGNPFVPLLPLMKDPSAKVLCQGVPPDTTFPVQSISVKLSDGTELTLNEEETKLAQRYAPFAWGPLREWLLRHVRQLHAPPTPDWDLAVGAGSMSSVDLVCALLLNRGDVVLIEEYSFLASLDALRSYGAELRPVALDAEGLQPTDLEAVCSKLQAEGKRAKMLYMVPVGQNPTGATLSSHRYKEIYEIARRYEILIVEDDAYFYQQHELRAGGPESCVGGAENSDPVVHQQAKRARILPGLRLGPSFLSIDEDGRVLRLDSFSKFLAPGFRLAWVTGPRPLVDKYNALAYASSQNGCSLSMMVLGKMLHTWDDQGLDAHLRKLQGSLRDRCDAMLESAKQHLGDSATWTRPKAGMFLWVRLQKPARSVDHLLEGMRANGVAVLPGEHCSARACVAPCPFLRLSFVLGDDHYPEAMRRVGNLLKALL